MNDTHLKSEENPISYDQSYTYLSVQQGLYEVRRVIQDYSRKIVLCETAYSRIDNLDEYSILDLFKRKQLDEDRRLVNEILCRLIPYEKALREEADKGDRLFPMPVELRRQFSHQKPIHRHIPTEEAMMMITLLEQGLHTLLGE